MRGRGTAIAVVAATALLTGACGPAKKDAVDGGGPSGAPSAAATPSPSPDAEVLFRPPAHACDALPASLAKRLKATRSKSHRNTATDCTWDIGTGNKYKIRSISVSYEASPSADLTKSLYESMKRADGAHGRGLGQPPDEWALLTQIGNQRKGAQFEEGYYSHYRAEIAGLTLGTGRVVLLKGNVSIDFTADGNDVLPPYTGRLRSKPIASGECKQTLDAVADAFVAAVVPKDGAK
jgi:hypothetical protein